jgi:hypothetical protein
VTKITASNGITRTVSTQGRMGRYSFHAFGKTNMTQKLFSIISCFGLLTGVSGLAFGQVVVDVPGVSVNVGKGKGGNTAISVGPGSTASNSSGSIDADVQMEGVAVINDDVFIDGEKIPRGKTKHTSKKTGKTYRIQWGKNGNVSVEQN